MKNSIALAFRWAAAAFLIFSSSSARLKASDTSNPNADGFFLHDGDRVCFYGDSITEQRFYGADIQAYVRTRFPKLKVDFINSGVGGDRVTGGWAGPVDVRLARDVFPYKPTVVTIMLGMNDARYRPFDQDIFSTYTNGYEHIIESLQAHLPGVRIVLIQPSAYDDITTAPNFPGGYNGVLKIYSAFVKDLAAHHGLTCADANSPLVDVVQQVMNQNPTLAQGILPGRVHPSAAGEMVMAQAILQAWNAPSLVSSVSLDGSNAKVLSANHARVRHLETSDDGLSWDETDESLPCPIVSLHNDWPQFPPYEATRTATMSFPWSTPKMDWNYTNTVMQATLAASHFYSSLDDENLQVTGLKHHSYRLLINGQETGVFSDKELDHGINLAEFHTPMLEQSYSVFDHVWQQIQWRYFAWREIQLKLSKDHDPAVQTAADDLVKALENEEARLAEEQYVVAKPRTMHYSLAPVQP